jgi:hypothetical protein
MANQYDNLNKRNTGPIPAGLMGAVLGAAVGVGVAFILSDPQKRRKVGKKVQDMQKWGNKTLQDLRETAEVAEEDMRETVADKTARVQKEIDEAAMQAQQKTK